MTKDDFKRLFLQALATAASNAEAKLGRAIPHQFEIELHGLAPQPRILSPGEAFEAIYLGPERFYRVIDVAVRRVSGSTSTVFLGISGHTPGPFRETWNDPPGTGPFKQVIAERVVVS